MIICSNCGTINNDEIGRFCRNCGALLPIPSKSSKVKVPFSQDSQSKVERLDIPGIDVSDEKKSKKDTAQKSNLNHITGEVRLFTSQKKSEKGDMDYKLEEIPKPQSINDKDNKQQIELKEKEGETLKNKLSNSPIEIDKGEADKKKEFLKEIMPAPFNGSILSAKGTQEPSKLSSKNIPQVKYLNINKREKKNLKSQNSQDLNSNSDVNVSEQSDSSLKMKQLEDDMSEVLSIISKKLKISKREESPIPPTRIETLKKISPSNMNEILNQLLKLDQYIEASAIIKEDGTILASVLSNRISDSLFATIGQNLSMIGTDIIEGLSAGKLTSISIKGTEGILDIAQIDKKNPKLNDLILMIFSHVRVKSGIIAFATKIVKNQIKELNGN